MRTFLAPLEEQEEFREARECLERGEMPIHVTGCLDSQKCHLIYGLGRGETFRVVVTRDELRAKEICEDMRLYGHDAFLYPAKDVMFYSADIRGNAIARERLQILRRVIEKEPTVIVTTIDGGMDRALPLEILKGSRVFLAEGDVVDLGKLEGRLVRMGYERCAQVEAPGQFAVRGGILDVFPLTEECPLRIELWDDEIDTIRAFDAESQRSIENVRAVTLYPATEILLDGETLERGLSAIGRDLEAYAEALRADGKLEEARRIRETVGEFRERVGDLGGSVGLESYIRYFYDDTSSFFDYFDREDAVFFLDEPRRIEEQGEAVELEFREAMAGRVEGGYILPGQVDVIYSCREVLSRLCGQRLALLSGMDMDLPLFPVRRKWAVQTRPIGSYGGNFEMLVRDLAGWKKDGYRMLLLAGSRSRAVRLGENLRENGMNAYFSEDLERELAPGEIMVTSGSLHKSFEYPSIRFVFLSESDIFSKERGRRQKRRPSHEGTAVRSFTDLGVGDYVVHENHGLGVYRGIEKIQVDGVTKDYLKIEYADGGILYVPATGLDALQKYAGADAKAPKLNKLNSAEWKKTKARVRGAVREIAKELVDLYASRQARQGYAFGPDTVWQSEFEELFPYEETQDQLAAIEATKRDMESHKIMDRLICGDVGFGKTEIAIRAAFKAAMDGKQVALLVPTTILAQQHYNTFTQRMREYPVRVEMLSRFRTAAEQRETLARLAKGQADVVIGTHRLLSDDVRFKDLGLLIVDEEQRFGVTHKEKIKRLKRDVDVLTLTATPIPRTLHMSLVGIRDMSVLEEPPVDRMPIQTYVLEHNDEIIREAICREMARGGQVYYVFNRVNRIDEVAANVSRLVPEARVALAHGQMNERELERIMLDFINGEIDVLVSTTIVETGLDIPNVNTMIIDDADRFGLSQLYQLRGRVGRTNRNAFAFFMYRRDKALKEEAERRLQAIREFTGLGSGIRIAMRDLEIRGAGNLLGAEQHGHMEAVGYDLYCKMLNEAVMAQKGERAEPEEEMETSVDMDMDAYIPPTYIRSESQKLEMYKRVADIETEEEFMDMQEELVDRFGEMPASVSNLLNIARIKAAAQRASITQITQRGSEARLFPHPRANIDIRKIPGLLESYGGAMKFRSVGEPCFLLDLSGNEGKPKLDSYALFEKVAKAVEDIGSLRADEEKAGREPEGKKGKEKGGQKPEG